MRIATTRGPGVGVEGDEVSGTEELVSGVSMAMAEGESRLFDIFPSLVHVVVIAVVPVRSPIYPVKH